MTVTHVTAGTRTILEIDEPGNLRLSGYLDNVESFQGLIKMGAALAAEDGLGSAYGEAEAAPDSFAVTRASYGSPFVIDGEFLVEAERLVSALGAVATLVGIYCKVIKVRAERDKTRAETEAILGAERREQYRFEIDDLKGVALDVVEEADEYTNRGSGQQLDPETREMISTLVTLLYKEASDELDAATDHVPEHVVQVFAQALRYLAEKGDIQLTVIPTLGRDVIRSTDTI